MIGKVNSSLPAYLSNKTPSAHNPNRVSSNETSNASSSGEMRTLEGFTINGMLTEGEHATLKSIYQIAGIPEQPRNETGALRVDPLKTRLALDKYTATKEGTKAPTLNLDYINKLLGEGKNNEVDRNLLFIARNYFENQTTG